MKDQHHYKESYRHPKKGYGWVWSVLVVVIVIAGFFLLRWYGNSK